MTDDPAAKSKPAKLAQKDRDALDHQIHKSQAEGGMACRRVDLAIPASATRAGQGRLPPLTSGPTGFVLDRDNTASEVWADTAYRSAGNEPMLALRGFVSRIHRKKPKGKTIPERTRIANAQKSKFAAPWSMCLRVTGVCCI